MIVKPGNQLINLLEDLIPILQRSYIHGKNYGKIFSGKEIPMEVILMIHSYERLTECMHTLSFLLEKIDKHFYIEYPIGLIIRSNIYEIMGIIYLTDTLQKKPESDFNKLFDSYHADQLKAMQNYMGLQKDLDKITIDEYNSYMDTINNELSLGRFIYDNINHKFDFTSVPRWPSAQQLFKLNQGNDISNIIQLLYNRYFFYSQYEHTGYFNAKIKGFEFDRAALGIADATLDYYRGLLFAINFIVHFLNKENMKGVVSQNEIISVESELNSIISDYSALMDDYYKGYKERVAEQEENDMRAAEGNSELL